MSEGELLKALKATACPVQCHVTVKSLHFFNQQVSPYTHQPAAVSWHSHQDDFENVEILAAQMGWKHQLDKDKRRKGGQQAQQPEIDHAQKPPYVAKRV